MYTLIKTLKIFGLTLIVFLSLVFSAFLLFVAQFPTDKELKGCFKTEFYQVYLCPNSEHYVRLSQISNYLEKSIVLTEDSSFWQHQGFDIEEIEKSLKKNLETGKYSRGGSTITQQLAKNLFLTPEKTIFRKIKEAIITIRLEKTLSKSEILERYLNVIQFGSKIYGIKDASWFYFKKKPSDLSIVESAFLTFLLPSPEKYSVSFFKKELTPFARKRLVQIIEKLHTYQRITDDEYQVAQSELSVFLNKSEFNDQDVPLNLEPENEELEQDIEEI